MTALVRVVPCAHPPRPLGQTRARRLFHALLWLVVKMSPAAVLAMVVGAAVVEPSGKVMHIASSRRGEVRLHSSKHLNEYMNIKGDLDPSDQPYQWALAEGARLIVVMSLGEDGADEVWSD